MQALVPRHIFINELATHFYLACPVCGATRKAENFGITESGEFEPAEAPSYTIRVSLKETGGGYRAISWTHHKAARHVLGALRNRVQAELDCLDALLAGEGEERLPCFACGNMAPPEYFGISEQRFDPDSVPHYAPVREVATDMEEKGFVWEREGLPVASARALVEALRAAAERLEGMIENSGG